MTQIAKHDDNAAARVYRHYHGFLYAYVRHRLADDSAAEDVAHDVFMSVFQKPMAYSGQAKFSTWLCAIAKFKTIDWWRQRNKDVPVIDISDDVIEFELDPNWDFVAQLEAAQDAQAVRYCMDKLPADHRDAIFWTFFQDAGLEEVTKHQNCPVGTVESRLFNARKRMRDCVSRWIQGGRYG